MFTTVDVAEKLEWLVTVQTQSIKEFVNCLQNKKLPLDSRWNLYKKYHFLLPIQIDGFDFFDYNLNITEQYTRHQLVNYVNIVELIEENYYEESLIFTPELIIEVKEKVLDSGFQGFYFDW